MAVVLAEEMEITTALSMAMMMIMVLPYNCMAGTNYTVGGNRQWNLGVDYATWATGKSFSVGDSLIFKYTTDHDVLEVTKSAYDSCSTSNPTATEKGGSTTILLGSAGTKYFICGTAGHCAGGMKLAIIVAAAAPTTGSATSPPPTSTKSPTVSSPTSAAMAASGVQVKDGLVFVGSLVLGALAVRIF